MIFLAASIGGCLIHWHWKAAIISLLSVEVAHIPFLSLDSLTKSEYQITLFRDSSFEDEFKTATTGPFQNAWETKFVDKERSLQADIGSMLDLVMEEKYVMYEGLRTATTFKEFQQCLVRDVGFTLTETDYAFGLAKDSEFKGAFSKALNNMGEHGHITRMQLKGSNSDEWCHKKEKEPPMNLENVKMALSILVCGIICGILICVLECIKKDWKFKLELLDGVFHSQKISRRTLCILWFILSIFLSVACFATIHHFQ